MPGARTLWIQLHLETHQAGNPILTQQPICTSKTFQKELRPSSEPMSSHLPGLPGVGFSRGTASPPPLYPNFSTPRPTSFVPCRPCALARMYCGLSETHPTLFPSHQLLSLDGRWALGCSQLSLQPSHSLFLLLDELIPPGALWTLEPGQKPLPSSRPLLWRGSQVDGWTGGQVGSVTGNVRLSSPRTSEASTAIPSPKETVTSGQKALGSSPRSAF